MKIKLTAAQRKAGVDLRDVMKVDGKTISERWDSFQSGAIAAADVADGYNSTSSHPYRLGDCILAKMNIGKRKPRANASSIPRNDRWMSGFAVALADMHRRLLHGNDSTSVCAVARAGGLTLKAARSAGVSSLDLKELKKAGIR